MKIYSTQWLPVKGEIFPGDHYTHRVDSHIEVEHYDPDFNYNMNPPSVANGDSKLLRYLVAADLEVGDLVVDILRPKEYGRVSEANVNVIDDSEIEWACNDERMIKCSRFSKGLAQKVLGLLSDDAIWVAMNQEIPESDIAWMCDDGSDELIPIEGKDFSGNLRMVFAVKCPSCKTFH